MPQMEFLHVKPIAKANQVVNSTHMIEHQLEALVVFYLILKEVVLQITVTVKINIVLLMFQAHLLLLARVDIQLAPLLLQLQILLVILGQNGVTQI